MRAGATISASAALLLLATAAPAQDPIAEQRQRLVRAKAAAAAAEARAIALDRSAAAERDAAAKAAREEAAIAARVAAAEADIAAARARIAIVDRLLVRQRAALAVRQTPIARLLAALQSLARRPLVAVIAQPGSVDDLVHVRAVLGGVLPVIRARTAAIRADLAETRRLQADATLAAEGLRTGRSRLLRERQALAGLQALHARQALALGRGALVESDRAIALGEEARDIVDRLDLIGGERATLASLRRLEGPPRTDSVVVPVKQAYRLPVSGGLLTGLGEVSDTGVRARGLTFTVARGAPVVAPAAGRVAFARPFRRYGIVIIIDHGAGWSTVMTGLARASINTGDRVSAGAPIGNAPGSGEPSVTVELRRRGRPVDITGLIG